MTCKFYHSYKFQLFSQHSILPTLRLFWLWNNRNVLSCLFLGVWVQNYLYINRKFVKCFGNVLWIALNFVSLTDWIQHYLLCCSIELVVNRFKFCIFDRLNTTSYQLVVFLHQLWIALNFVSLTDWIQLFHFFYF